MQGGTYIKPKGGGPVKKTGGTKEHPDGNRARHADGQRLNRPGPVPAPAAPAAKDHAGKKLPVTGAKEV